MTKIVIPFVLLLFFMPTEHVNGVTSNDTDIFNAATIPAHLLTDANAVIRTDERQFTSNRPGNGRLDVRRVVTVLNPEGRNFSIIQIPYEPFMSVSRISGTIYDAEGNRVRRIRGREIRDEPAVSMISLAEDSRVKIIEMTHTSYPYTIEIEYRYDFSSFINFPSWSPISPFASLEHAHYEVIVPEDMPVMYTSRNFSDGTDKPEITENGRNKHYLWTLSNINRPLREALSPTWSEINPQLIVSSNEFEFEGYSGSLENWEEFGKWFHGLWDGRTGLTYYDRQLVAELTDGLEDERVIVSVLYSHLQGNTRYISIQLGIGGFQTETAIATSRNRYGDCKALTNYLLAMLLEAGIEAYPALILSGNPGVDIITDIPNQGFNHVILYIPLDSGDMWIESTSSVFPPGYIGLGNAGKYTLIFSEEGGYLTKTPEYSYNLNTQVRKGTVRLSLNGNATAEVSTTYREVQTEHLLFNLVRANQRDQERFLSDMIRIPRFELTNFEFTLSDSEAEVTLDLSLDLPSVATVAGNRIFLKPNLMERRRYQLPPVTFRTLPARLSYPYHDTDIITWTLPGGFNIEALPEQTIVETEFATFISEITFDQSERALTLQREIKVKKSYFEPHEYDALRQFFDQVSRADNAQVVLARN